MKQYAQSCEENQQFIYEAISPFLSDSKRLLEIGSGTGQHAVYMATRIPHLFWQTSDRAENHASITAWIRESGLDNLGLPYQLDVRRDPWPEQTFDAVFSANTLHIMHWNDVQSMFSKLVKVLKLHGLVMIYGPFNYQGKYSSASNQRFDTWLKQRDPASGIRDIADLNQLAENAGLQHCRDLEMPVNNRIMIWEKIQN
jgi:cyclopropane fatty-acyl-phospholipid synthase-like methyltransferase